MHNRFEMRRSAGIPIEVIAPDWDDPLEFISGDLSPRGTYLHTDLMPQIGEHLVCSFNLKTNMPDYCFFGEVTRVNLLRRKCDGGHPGFGIRFLDAKPFERMQIRQALRGLPPPVPKLQREKPIELTSAMLISS